MAMGVGAAEAMEAEAVAGLHHQISQEKSNDVLYVLAHTNLVLRHEVPLDSIWDLDEDPIVLIEVYPHDGVAGFIVQGYNVNVTCARVTPSAELADVLGLSVPGDKSSVSPLITSATPAFRSTLAAVPKFDLHASSVPEGDCELDVGTDASITHSGNDEACGSASASVSVSVSVSASVSTSDDGKAVAESLDVDVDDTEDEWGVRSTGETFDESQTSADPKNTKRVRRSLATRRIATMLFHLERVPRHHGIATQSNESVVRIRCMASNKYLCSDRSKFSTYFCTRDGIERAEDPNVSMWTVHQKGTWTFFQNVCTKGCLSARGHEHWSKSLGLCWTRNHLSNQPAGQGPYEKLRLWSVHYPSNLDLTIPKSTFFDELKRMVNDEATSDVKLVLVDDANSVVFAHKMLLCARSPHFFRSMLSSGMQESNAQEIRLYDTRRRPLLLLLLYLYTDCVDYVSVHEALDVWIMADRYLLPRLCRITERYLHVALDANNVLAVLLRLHEMGTPHRQLLTRIRRLCLECVLLRWSVLMAADAFQNLLPELREELYRYRRNPSA